MKKNTSFFHQNYCPLFREESAVVEGGKRGSGIPTEKK